MSHYDWLHNYLNKWLSSTFSCRLEFGCGKIHICGCLLKSPVLSWNTKLEGQWRNCAATWSLINRLHFLKGEIQQQQQQLLAWQTLLMKINKYIIFKDPILKQRVFGHQNNEWLKLGRGKKELSDDQQDMKEGPILEKHPINRVT